MSPFYRTWLTAWCWATLAFGVVLVDAAFPPFDLPARFIFDLVYWPLDGAPAITAPEIRFATGVCGAVMLGWGWLMLAIVKRPETDPALWRAMVACLLIWFIPDSIVSLKTGATLNVVSNVLLLAMFLYPVLASGVLKQRSDARHALQS
jgi:hypothetical protein